jgi:phage shock protein PspC (stress-responsive transcriptional regulator)
MDNIERIHIAKVPYSIEPKAKEALKKYLADVRAHLDADTADEVIHDIESRIPELLAQHHTKQNDVVTQADIQFIKKQLGEPEQFTSHDEQSQQFSGSNPKKLFRDMDNAMLGGVASGIGKYFSIDANFIRIAFFVATFFYGFGVLLYLFLWLLLPEAKTSADKLLMSGEPVTVSTLQRYRATVNKSLGDSPRVLQHILGKLFRLAATAGTGLISLVLLCVFGAFSALFYVDPFSPIVSGYRLDYLFLGLAWIGCLAFIGLLVLLTAKIWGNGSTRINIVALALSVLLIVTIAGESASGLLIYNHFSSKYGGDKSVRSLNIGGVAVKPTSLMVSADNNLDLTYYVSNQPLHAAYDAYPGMNHPNITIKDDAKGVVTVTSDQLAQAAPTCLGDLCKHIYLPVHVFLYGPSLQEYDNTNGAVLTINNSNLGAAATFTTRNGSMTNINNSYAAAMTISSTANSSVDATNTTAQSATLSVDSTSNITSPITNNLAATLPEGCDQQNAYTILFLAAYPLNTTINGQPQSLANLQQNSCIGNSF